MMKRTLIALAMTLSVAAPAMADEALAKSKNCMSCHAVDKKLVGPSYKDVAKKYAGDKAAADALATKVMKISWSATTDPELRDFPACWCPG
jgi:cytochrome c